MLSFHTQENTDHGAPHTVHCRDKESEPRHLFLNYAPNLKAKSHHLPYITHQSTIYINSLANQLTSMSDQMATAPVEIGTRGTVGSLVLQEIEHFSKLALDRSGTHRESGGEVSSAGRGSRPKLWFVFMTMKRKRNGGGGGGGLLPNMCDMVDVVETNRVVGTSQLNYRNLKNDVKKLKG